MDADLAEKNQTTTIKQLQSKLSIIFCIITFFSICDLIGQLLGFRDGLGLFFMTSFTNTPGKYITYY